MSVQGQNALILAALAMSYSRYGDKRFGLVATGPEATIEPDFEARARQAALSFGYDLSNPARRCNSERYLNAR